MHLPAATIRTQVMLPLRFADGFGTTARVYTFDGLADGRRASRPRPGRRRRCLRIRRSRRWSGSTASASPATSSGASAATAGRSCSRRSGASRRSGRLLLYLRQEGRRIGLYAKLDAYALQDTAACDTYDANLALGYSEDGRDYTVAAQMLRALGLDRVALLSNNPDKAAQLHQLGVTVVGARADRGAPQRDQRSLPGHEGRQRRTHAGPPVR